MEINTPQAAATVTVSNADFEYLLKMAHQGQSTLPSASVAIAGISVSDSPFTNSWLSDSGAIDCMTGNLHLFSSFKLVPKSISVSLD